ncbi:phosphoadenosine phosphosulfate reductase domain-containing protein, partial [Staphylococcus warneri]|uniref:phosphoadenosine phosphosulfate reductase domain-containing protein n=1 Tax=Staphylococcus warneri TaxID=1292 RepID=UPI00164304F9
SFGGESMVVIDLIYEMKGNAKIVFLDSELDFEERYKLIDEVKRRYGELGMEMKKRDLTLEEEGDEYNRGLWKNNGNECCYIRK